jgi:hypothetical protein
MAEAFDVAQTVAACVGVGLLGNRHVKLAAHAEEFCRRQPLLVRESLLADAGKDVTMEGLGLFRRVVVWHREAPARALRSTAMCE